MAEEVENSNDGTWSGLKKTIIGVATTAVMGLGTWGVTKITGGGDDKKDTPVATPVININNTQQQSAGKTVIVNGGGNGATTKPAEPAKPVKKKEGDEFKEKPAQW